MIFDTIENVSSIDDLIKISKVKGANITILLETAFIRGFKKGVDFAKEKAIKAIREEK